MLTLSASAGRSNTANAGREVYREATEDVRRAAAEQRLAGQTDLVVVYARGLCCLSCAIGIRTKVKKLDFVDRERLEQGVELDAQTQLVTIAIQPGETVDPAALAVAIDRAGYEPERLYMIQDDAFVDQPLTLD